MKLVTTYCLYANRNNLYCLLLSAAFACMATAANAQGNSLQGVVKDEITLTPLKDVSIELHSAKDSSQLTGTVTNSTGFFALNKIHKGDYYVLVSSVSYEPKIITEIDFNQNSIDIGIITLKAAINSLRAVVVSAKRGLISNSLDRQVY